MCAEHEASQEQEEQNGGCLGLLLAVEYAERHFLIADL
jgi:hypothetical protein